MSRVSTGRAMPRLIASPREADRGAPAPEHDRHHEVDDEDQGHGQTDGPAHGLADALGAAAGVEAVGAVDEGHETDEHQHLEDAVDDVEALEVDGEVLAVDA